MPKPVPVPANGLRRADEDEDYIAAFAKRIGELYPASPRKERQEIARHTCRRSSGRIGRSAAARELEESAVDLAVRAHVRHAHSRYDELMVGRLDRLDARAEVAADVEGVLRAWRGDAHDS